MSPVPLPPTATVTHITPSYLLVKLGERTVKVGGEAVVTRPAAPYFVFSDSIRTWEPPHEGDALTRADREDVLRAVRAHLERNRQSYVVDPSDEQYRSL